MSPRRLRLPKMTSVTIRLPEDLVAAIDDLAEEADTSRTEIMEEILSYVMAKEDLVDEIFPEEGEGEEEEEDEGESED